MNDNQRTVAYIVVAALAVVVATEPWSGRAALATRVDETGKLFPDFKDPRAASSMTISKYDEATATLHRFQVARVGGVWSIPSHQNYPADAKEQLAKAATALMGVEILDVASTKPGDHELYGVLDPDSKTATPGSVGIGTRVTMKDGKDNVLADLIIGKADKELPKVRYVRRAAQDQVYKVEIQTDKLTTKFGDWIEKDLLKLNPLDILSVQLNDYSSDASTNLQGQLAVGREFHSQIVLDYDEAKSAWKLKKLTEYVDGKPVPDELKENEELNAEKLAALKTALDDLKIVDVERKPAGMKDLRISPDVSRAQFFTQLQSLAQRGYFPVGGNADGSIDLLSSEGEAIVSLKDGTQYVLRFGNVAASDEETKDDESKDSTGKKEPGSRVNRYLFVMAQFDPDLIPKPTLQPLPGEDADQPADDDAKPDADDKKEPAAGADKAADGKPDAKPGDADSPAKAIDKQAEEEDAAERKKREADQRTKIDRDNKLKQDQYEEKLKKGEQHVKELNERFADWYYIISDDVYHKVHLSRADVVKTKEVKPGEGDSPADLQELQKKGLKKEAKP